MCEEDRYPHSLGLRLLPGDFRLWVYANLFLVPALTLEANDAGLQREQCIVAADANVQARMDVGAALANKDVAGEDELAIRTLRSKALRVAVATVTRATYALFVRKELQIHLKHSCTSCKS